MLRKLGGVLSIILCCFLMGTPLVSAQSATVTIGVGDTILKVSGKTSPDAFVTISKDGSVIGTVVADGSGVYEQVFTAQESGLHQLQLFAHTVGNANTDAISTTVNIAEHATTEVAVFLPSTLQMDDTTLTYQQPLSLSGEAAPNSTIAVYIDNMVYSSAATDSQGRWSLATPTASLGVGQHGVFVRVTDSFGDQSYPTAIRYFNLEGKAPAPEQPISKGPAPGIPAITFPKTGTVWNQPAISIVGTADSRVQVELWDANRIIGSIWSSDMGEWRMRLLLEARDYILRARACLQRTCSAFSEPVRLTYDPGGPLPPAEQPLRVHVPVSHFTIYADTRMAFRASVITGQPPYRTTLDWGDGQTDTMTFIHKDLLYSHSYARPGKYTATMAVQDALGRKNQVYFTVDVRPREPNISVDLGLFILIILVILWLYASRQRHKASKKNKTPARSAKA